MYKGIMIYGMLLTILLYGTFSKSEEAAINGQCRGEIIRSGWPPYGPDRLDVIILSFFEPSLGSCIRNLKIEKHDSSEMVYFEEMAEQPVAVWPIGNRLFTLWESGSAFWISVYESDKLKISKILDVRSKGMPEITFSKNGSEGIIVTNYMRVENTATGTTEAIPQNADIYIWQENKYEAYLNIPWAQRFEKFVK